VILNSPREALRDHHQAPQQELRGLLTEASERLKDRRLEPAATRAAALLNQAVRLRSSAEQQQRSPERVLASNPSWMPHGAMRIPGES
jgi:hypothetical protein